MANYFVPLAAQKPGPGLNLEPVNAALDAIIQQQNQKRQFGMQQQQIDQRQAEQTYQHGRDAKQDGMQQVQLFGKQATAVDQLQGPQRAAAWSSILARHGTTNLTPEELDPVTGPKLMAAQAGQFLDPRDSQAKDLGLQKTRAEIDKLNSEAANSGDAYGKSGTVVQGSDGKYYSIQFGSHGQRQILPMEIGGTPAAAGTSAPGVPQAPPVSLSPQRGVDVVGDQMFDKATGAPVRNVGGNIASGKSAQIQGEAQGKAVVNLPLSENSANRMIGAIDNLLGPNSGLERVTGTVYGRLPEWTNTSDQAKNAQSQIEYINGNTFLQAYNDLRGAGAITEKEGQAAQAAYNRLRSQQLGTDAYKQALTEFRGEVVRLRDIARNRANGGPPQSAHEDNSGGGWSIKRID